MDRTRRYTQLFLWRKERRAEPSAGRRSLQAPNQRASTKERASGKVGDPLLSSIWIELRREWFPAREDLDDYRVVWSTRKQKRTLASCNIVRHKVTVARELRPEPFRCWLRPLLYHEMCHAYLGSSVVNQCGRSSWHGRDFKRLEKRHPDIPTLDHWIRCGGWERAVRFDRARRAALVRWKKA